MDPTMAHLGTLIEQLEDARQFHAAAAQRSVSDTRDRHLAQSRAYAAMLAEITDWEAHNRRGSAARRESGPRPDGYAALLERIYRIHSAAAPARATFPVRATDDAMAGAVTDGRRRARPRS